MRLTRRDFCKAALALPIGSALAHYEALAAPARGQVKITAVKCLRLNPRRRGTSQGLIKVETDAGLVGYGPGVAGPDARAAIASIANNPGIGLIGKDPLAIRVHFHNMFYARSQRERYIRVCSGIDMALWDLAGKILDAPVSRLLGGNFRSEIDTYSHLMPPDRSLSLEEAQKDYLSPEKWKQRAQLLKGGSSAKSGDFGGLDYKGGFRAFKIDIHPSILASNGVFRPDIGPQIASQVRRVFELAREALGPDYDIIVHGHNELDTPSAIKVAEAVEGIKPLWYEDPLPPLFSESWMALRRSSRVPIMTGENIVLVEEALPFLQNQAVDCLQPDLVQSGGITGVKIIADMAAVYRTPIALHSVGGYALNLASQQFAASVFNCPRIECRPWFDEAPEAAGNIPVVKNGRMQVASLPGLGILLNDEYMKANLADGETWWG
ncbi:MAG TPA: mandelate racemase/muconate lactonizing enzyme family protein [Bryobacteraceae bacterium]|nr:mandelate racemase/muconate lactonizing enzyme family protein [Bryobacteraceae bacterium]